MASIDIVDLNKHYGAFHALRDIQLSIDEGEFVALVGPSGCGKTTLLRILAGLETISSGVIAFDGRVMNEIAPQDRNIAMVFQSYALYPHMTVRKNMAFCLEQARLPRDEIDRRVGKAARTLGIESMLDRYPRALSGGQRQRVAMGRAIVREPIAFLFDEPLSNLDAQLQVSMRTEIRTLQRQLKVTTVYVTHDQVEAMTMADRVVLINEGRIMQAGAPLDLYDEPENAFVAGFIGSPRMNLLKGSRSGSRIQLDGGGLDYPQGDGWLPPHFTVGVRPECLRLANGDCADAPQLRATVRNVEQLGPETEVVLVLGANLITLRHSGRLAPSIGADLILTFDSDKLLFFDVESGKRISRESKDSP